MTDLQFLYVVLALLYLWECAHWLRRGSVAFATALGRRWRLVHPSATVGNQRGGFVLASPLPPLGTLLVGTQFPLSFSPQTVLAFVPHAVNPGGRATQSGTWVAFDKIQDVEARGKKLLVNRSVLLRTDSPSFAGHLAETIRDLQRLSPDKRGKAIERVFRDSLDTKALERCWADFGQKSGTLRWCANVVFGYVFALVPLVIGLVGFRRCWLALLLGLLAATTTTAISFYRAHKALYPEAEDERFTHFIMVLLAPATTIRACDILSRPLCERFHPLVLAQMFCSEKVFRDLARRVLLDIRNPCLPLCPPNQPAAAEAESYSRAALKSSIEDFLTRHGCELKELTKPPEPMESNCLSYCPRCLGQFTTREGVCPDCGGLPLIPFRVTNRA